MSRFNTDDVVVVVGGGGAGGAGGGAIQLTLEVTKSRHIYNNTIHYNAN